MPSCPRQDEKQRKPLADKDKTASYWQHKPVVFDYGVFVRCGRRLNGWDERACGTLLVTLYIRLLQIPVCHLRLEMPTRPSPMHSDWGGLNVAVQFSVAR